MADRHAPPGGAERTLYVLAVLARHGQPLCVADLAGLTGLAVSTLYRQLALLKHWGFVQENAGAYAPGPTCLQLAWGFDQTSWLVRETLPEIQKLSNQTNETVGLMVAVQGQVVCLDMVESRLPLRCAFTKGKGLPLTRGASAKALLAFMASAQRKAVLQDPQAVAQLGDEGLERLSSELEQIRRQGYAVSTNEVDEGVWGVSVPIIPHVGKLLGAITVMAPVSRVENRRQQLTDLTVEAVRRIATRLHGLD
ncbi:IclR family transcriptional regulator [Paracandidimonas soli]|uniref:IclR family transcriptional regulator n=1 Tax=Paracandidimonas soli TaxID=1917182 RepID=UPI003342980E